MQRVRAGWRRCLRAFAAVLFCAALAPLSAGAAPAGAEFAVPNGYFYSEANGQGGGPGQPGFTITDSAGMTFWTTFSQGGGVATYGYPISTPYEMGGFTEQAMQKSIFQWNTGAVAYLNVLDILHQDGRDAWLQANYLTPPPLDTSADTGLTWPQVVARHQGFLDGNPAIKAAYFAVPDPVALYGLPVTPPTPEANGAVVVVRCQRGVLQQWLTAQPWAAAGQVTVANAGDIAKAAGILPSAALVPQAPPTGASGSAPVPYPVSSSTSVNWAGYVAATNLAGGAQGSVDDVRAQWSVPTVDCGSTPDAASAVWVGIDGVYSNTVEQTGTSAECRAGQAAYSAWLEIYPLASRTTTLTVRPGDVISAEVAHRSGLQFQISLHDLTSGQGFSVRRFSPGARSSAEWVVEAPAVGGQIAPLANFGVATLSQASVTINGRAGPITGGAWQAQRVVMASRSVVKASPSPTSADGASFQVTWQHS